MYSMPLPNSHLDAQTSRRPHQLSQTASLRSGSKKDNVPGFVTLLKALGSHCAAGHGSLGYHLVVMYTININNGYGMELPQAVKQNIPQ
jgi:hypothetical protein